MSTKMKTDYWKRNYDFAMETNSLFLFHGKLTENNSPFRTD